MSFLGRAKYLNPRVLGEYHDFLVVPNILAVLINAYYKSFWYALWYFFYTYNLVWVACL